METDTSAPCIVCNMQPVAPKALRPLLRLSTRAGYSLWSNRSFKAPVVAGAVACLLGNVLYCLSYDVRALWMLMLSRFVMGFGAPAARSLVASSGGGNLCQRIFLYAGICRKNVCLCRVVMRHGGTLRLIA